jgi:hypothetical protein
MPTDDLGPLDAVAQEEDVRRGDDDEAAHVDGWSSDVPAFSSWSSASSGPGPSPSDAPDGSDGSGASRSSRPLT